MREPESFVSAQISARRRVSGGLFSNALVIRKGLAMWNRCAGGIRNWKKCINEHQSP